MTESGRRRPGPEDSGGSGLVPVDVPAARPTGVDRLGALVGEWVVEASFPLDPPATVSGRTTFEWLEGRFFLVQRWTVDHPEAPDGLAMIGAAEGGTFAQHYYDSRGVHRIYEMSLEDEVWRLWRDSPGFAQRFVGRFSDDRQVIAGAWEKSPDGVRWEHDFAMTYRKVA